MNIADWLNRARTLLAESGCPDPEVDARWIAEDTLSMSWASLKFEGEREVTGPELARLDARLNRRLTGEPVQYILGRASFMGLDFVVDRRVLIPRQDTETLAEAALIELKSRAAPAVLDLCTGSGCVGLSLKNLAPHSAVTLTDISRDALEVARANAKALGADVTLRPGDLFAAVGREAFDVIVSNPPYIPAAQLPGLQAEVRFEPGLALDGGEDGLSVYRRIAGECGPHLRPGGAMYLEVGIGQADDVLALLRDHLAPADSGAIRDLNGIDRVVWARMPGQPAQA